MPPLLSISAFRRTDANGGSRGEAMPEREIKQRVSESRAKRVWALPSGSCFDQRSIIVKREQKMTETFGHSNNFATLSLSQALTSNTSIKNRGHPRVNIRLFLLSGKGGRIVFLSPMCTLRGSSQSTVYKHHFY